METDFEYEIGDFVTMKSMLMLNQLFEAVRSPETRRRLPGRVPQVMTILERLWQECPGGVQKQYKVRVTAGSHLDVSFVRDGFMLHEEELARFDPEEFTKGLEKPEDE